MASAGGDLLRRRNVVLYSGIPSERREPCVKMLRAIARGNADGRTSTAALEEVWHIEWRGRRAASRASPHALTPRSPPFWR